MELKEIMTTCRSFRRFEQEPVPTDLLKEAVDIARQRSSACNFQPLRYSIVTNPDLVKQMHPYMHYAAQLTEKGAGDPKEGEQPTALILIKISEGEKTPWSDIDVGIAADTICSFMWSKGYGSCMLGNINRPAMMKVLGESEENEKLRIAIVFGKPAHECRVVPLPANGDTRYYVDSDMNFYVPKKAFGQVARVYE